MKPSGGLTVLGFPFLMACVATTLPLAGCSFIFIQPPHEDDGYRRVTTCTTSPVAPIIDTIFTLTNFGSAAYVASENNVTNKGTAVAAGLAVGALWLSSAIYGYYNTNRCSELQTGDDERPYRGPVHTTGSGWGGPVAPRRAPPPPAPPPAPAEVAPAPPAAAAAPAEVAPSPQTPVVPQQPDDDDPGRR